LAAGASGKPRDDSWEGMDRAREREVAGSGRRGKETKVGLGWVGEEDADATRRRLLPKRWRRPWWWRWCPPAKRKRGVMFVKGPSWWAGWA